MKIYTDNEKLINPWWHSHSTFIDLEKDRWVYTDNFAEATIIPIIGGLLGNSNIEFLNEHIKDHHILLILDIFDINDLGLKIEDLQQYYNITKKIIYLHQNYKLKNDVRFVYYDCMWDRQKLYCTDYKKLDNLDKNTWTREALPEVFQLGPIDKTPVKKFLSPQRIYPGSHKKQKIRLMLQKFLESYSEQGYISYVGTGGTVLGTNNDSNILPYVAEPAGGVWYPVADSYYNSSYISIYTETLIPGHNASCVTEKTFDPLIKGNFILPFGYQGLVAQISEQYGFQFPHWIDYSYDDIENDYIRFGKYLDSVESILNYNVESLHNFYLKDKSILEHNRNIFYTRDYCKIYDNVCKFINSQNW